MKVIAFILVVLFAMVSLGCQQKPSEYIVVKGHCTDFDGAAELGGYLPKRIKKHIEDGYYLIGGVATDGVEGKRDLRVTCWQAMGR